MLGIYHENDPNLPPEVAKSIEEGQQILERFNAILGEYEYSTGLSALMLAFVARAHAMQRPDLIPSLHAMAVSNLRYLQQLTDARELGHNDPDAVDGDKAAAKVVESYCRSMNNWTRMVIVQGLMLEQAAETPDKMTTILRKMGDLIEMFGKRRAE